MESGTKKKGGKMLNGLSGINVELTSRCNKKCWMCGRRKIEKEYPELMNWGNMNIGVVRMIAAQIPRGVFVQFHNNGEPLLYPFLGSAIRAFSHCYTGLDTNGKLLMEHRQRLSLLDTLTISVIQEDPEGEEQLQIIGEYLRADRNGKTPIIVFRLLGHIDKAREEVLKEFQYDNMLKQRIAIARRVLHAPDGSRDYEKPVTIPETGVCQEMLHKLSIDRFGNVSPCVRFDPYGKNIFGNLGAQQMTLPEIWDGATRHQWIQAHLEGRREDVPLCVECDYWGCPVSS